MCKEQIKLTDKIATALIDRVESLKNNMPSMYKNFALMKLYEMGINTTEIIIDTIKKVVKEHDKEVIEVQEPITWQQIEQLNLSYGTLLEIIAELVNSETSIEDAREKILDGDLD
tara:strand:- start:284 stop:628 length:345 start_codon:yes stop_codon:yes gene_type:complete